VAYPQHARRSKPAGFIPPALPMLVAKPPSGPGWTHEIKHFRILARKEGRRVTFWTIRPPSTLTISPMMNEARSDSAPGATADAEGRGNK
jgi:hypothetical protein